LLTAVGQTVGQSGNPGCVDPRVPGVRSTVPPAMLADRQNNTSGYAAPCPLLRPLSIRYRILVGFANQCCNPFGLFWRKVFIGAQEGCDLLWRLASRAEFVGQHEL